MGGDTGAYIGQFREGRTEADTSCSVNKGAFLTVEDCPASQGMTQGPSDG
jgi:hypothetical protein